MPAGKKGICLSSHGLRMIVSKETARRMQKPNYVKVVAFVMFMAQAMHYSSTLMLSSPGVCMSAHI